MAERDTVDTNKTSAPWRKFFGRFSFYAIAAQYFVVQFVIALFLIWLPTYLAEEYHVQLKDMGTFAAVPWLAMFILILSGGTISDKIISSGYSKFAGRGIIAIIGFAVFCGALYFSLMAKDVHIAIIWFSLSLGGIGLSMGMSWAAATDLGRNFSGTVSGWMNLWGNIGALISPILCGFLADKIGWTNTLMLTIIPVIFAIIMWFFVKPDQPLLTEEK